MSRPATIFLLIVVPGLAILLALLGLERSVSSPRSASKIARPGATINKKIVAGRLITSSPSFTIAIN